MADTTGLVKLRDDLKAAGVDPDSHAGLTVQRESLGPLTGGDPTQIELAAKEHEAFAREYATAHPILGALSLPFAIPAYTLSKFVGYKPSGKGTDTTPPLCQRVGRRVSRHG